MPISLSAKLATYKRWSASLVVGPKTYKLTDMPSRTMGSDQQRGTCTMTISEYPDEVVGAAAYVDITLNTETERFFTGKVDVRPISDSPPEYQITLIDTLGRLDKKLGSAVSWHNTTWIAAVRDLLHKAGITDGEIAAIYDPGSEFKLGANYTIKLEKGESIEAILRELMEFAGADLTTDPDGKVRVVDSPGWPEDEPTIVYAFGANKDEGEFGHTGSHRTLGGSEDRVKSFKAKGPRRPDLSIPDATFTLTLVDGKYEEKEYKYCQTNSCAAAIAGREIVRLNREGTEVEVNAPLNPSIRSGDSVMFRDAILGFASNTPALVLAVSSTGHMMTMRLSVGAKPAEGTLTYVAPPVANFTMQFEQQPIAIAGVHAVRVLVQVTDTSTDTEGYTITSWEYAASCDTGVEPESSSERNPNFIFNTLDNAQITLTVESTSGEGDVTTKSVTASVGEVFTRTLSAATPDGWFVLAGMIGWRSWGSDCTAVPGINDNGPMIAGFSDGKVYKTDDWLATEPEELGVIEGEAIRCLFVNELDTQSILAGSGPSLYQSHDGGVTWSLLHTFPDDINYCESSPANADEISVCAGEHLYWTTDGSSFEVLRSGPEGSTCRKLASAPWGHLAVWSGTEDIGDAYQFVEDGKSLNWTGVPPENLPIDLASVTPLQYEEGYLLVSGAANDIVRDGLYQQLAYLAAGGESTPIYKATSLGDGSFWVEYRSTGTTSGVNKVVNHKSAYLIAEPEVAFRVGYGAPTGTPEPPELIVLPLSQSGETDKILHYKPLTGWDLLTPPLGAAAWYGIAINHVNPAQWIIWTETNGRAFYTGNSGLTWLEINLAAVDGSGLQTRHVWSFAFTGDGAKWVCSCTFVAVFGAARSTQAYYAAGDGGTVSNERTYGDGIVNPLPSGTCRQIFKLIPGAIGEVFGCGTQNKVTFLGPSVFNTFTRQYWVDAATLVVTTVGDTDTRLYDNRIADGRQALGAWASNVGQTPNYKTTLPSPVISAGSSVIEALSGVFVGDREGIAQIVDFDTSPVVTVLAGAGVEVGQIVRGRWRRGIAARAVEPFTSIVDPVSYHIFAFNGTEWVVVDTPPGIGISDALGIVEL